MDLKKTLQNQTNHPVEFQNFIEQNHYQGYTTTSLSKLYYPYNQQIVDYGWGCAWRAIQTALSPIKTTFYDLFGQYSKCNKLNSIIAQRYQEQKILDALEMKKNKWCPQFSSNHWAQPFIGRLVLDDHKIKNQLFVVNNLPQFANVPDNVFDKILTFQEFKNRLIQHFNLKKGVIFIDDALFALCIWGYKIQGDNIKLLIADPHIKSNKQLKFTGIYSIELDTKGNLISHSVTEDQKKHFGYSSYETLFFNNKDWMVLFVDI